MKHIIIALIFALCLVGCTTGTYRFISPNGENEITIKTDGDIRYIINGLHREVPDSGYVKIDLSSVDRGAGDQIVGCWDTDGFEWVIRMHNVMVLENRLDTSRHLFLDHFPMEGPHNIPTLKGYTDSNCFSISFDYRFLGRVEGAVIKR